MNDARREPTFGAATTPSMPRTSARGPVAALLLSLGWGCAGTADGTGQHASPIVYGDDDRREFFESETGERTLMATSLAALTIRRYLTTTETGAQIDAPTLSEKDDLCAGERFGDQPAAALCSGVLVDWDLVLTAGHCVHVVPLDELVIVFDFFYREPGRLTPGENDIYEVSHVVAEAENEAGARPHFDYAWLRLKRPVAAPRAPAPMVSDVNRVRVGAGITFMGAPGGVPLKIDRGAAVFGTGEPWRDLFVANTDTAGGSSGGGAFDRDGALVGILEGGGRDYLTTDEGCNRSFRPGSDVAPEESFPYAARALAGLCATAPTASSLCRADCGDPCVALPFSVPPDPSAGCALAPGANRSAPPWQLSFLLLVAARSLKPSRRSSPTPPRRPTRS